MIQESKQQKELLYLPNKSTAQTAVSKFYSKKLHKRKVFTGRREGRGWERGEKDLIS